MKTNTDLFEKFRYLRQWLLCSADYDLNAGSCHLQYGRYLFYWPDPGSAAGCGCIFGNTGIYDFYGAGKPVWHWRKFGYIQGIR